MRDDVEDEELNVEEENSKKEDAPNNCVPVGWKGSFPVGWKGS